LYYKLYTIVELELNLFIVDEQAMERLAAIVANHVPSGLVFYLQGDLGAGKTTFVRGFLRHLGFKGAVKSPTFTLVEPYSLQISGKTQEVFHFDLYRLSDPEELEYMGIQDYLDGEAISLIEWPDKGQGILAPPDIMIMIHYQGRSRELELKAISKKGLAFFKQIESQLEKI